MSDSEDVELVRRGLERWNARDVDGMLEMATADFEWVPAIAATVDGGTVHGPDEFRAFFSQMDETWDEFRLEAEDVRPIGDCVVFFGRVHAKGRGSGIEIDQPLTSVCWLRDGKLERMQSFLDRDEAIQSAETG